MSKLFDKIFVNRVNDVFKNHEEEYNPSDWQKLQSRMNKPKRGLVVIWPHIAKAASVVLFLGVAVFTANKYEYNNTSNNLEGKVVPKRIEESGMHVANSKTDSVNREKSFSETYANAYKKNNHNTVENKIVESAEKLEGNEVVLISENDFNTFGNERFGNVKEELLKHHVEIYQMDSVQSNSNKPILKEYDEFIIAENSKKNNRRFDFGVELASVSNYSMEGSSDGVNFGGGVAAAYNITKKISITTGAVIAKQSVNYVGESQNEAAFDELNMAFQGNSARVKNMTSSNSEVSFIAIDVPLNVRFKHKRISFTTGLSSLFYVQEKYSYSYNAVVRNSVYNYETKNYDAVTTNTSISNEESKSFNHFDFARLLNLSIGYDIPLAKGNLVVEPYLKYPLGSISSKEISMGSGGFALRYNF